MNTSKPILAQIELTMFKDGSVALRHQGETSILLNGLKTALDKQQLQVTREVHKSLQHGGQE
ncbi:hypothetical protein [Chromobacterium violaceum]|uniref:hypothetical protein n=1 Tax=Chromobacterium violaceum TaxID=536 RepID=UPI00194EB5AD|nr:hypothetical protein [Chromobacterium violaceum]QRO32600.1 hypothetical protein I6K04_19335 [Chromobacterium violaceum]QRQ17599.1 hypothetical protein I6K03_03390 [Chromobacterium violaceum]